MCLQKHKLTPDSYNKPGKAAKILRSTVSTWLVTRYTMWLGLFPDFSLYSVLTLKPTLILAWRDVREAKHQQTATSPGMGLLVQFWFENQGIQPFILILEKF